MRLPYYATAPATYGYAQFTHATVAAYMLLLHGINTAIILIEGGDVVGMGVLQVGAPPVPGCTISISAKCRKATTTCKMLQQ